MSGCYPFFVSIIFSLFFWLGDPLVHNKFRQGRPSEQVCTLSPKRRTMGKARLSELGKKSPKRLSLNKS